MDRIPAPQLPYDFKSAKKQFSRIGLALFVFFVVTYAVVFALEFFLIIVFRIYDFSYTASVLISCVAMYGFGLPVAWICLTGTKKSAPPRGSIRPGTVAILLVICQAFGYVGNLLGMLSTALFEKLSGLTFTVDVTEMISDLPWYVILLYVVLIGPFFEELLFRKLILDRTRVYGEKTAILFSAILFGLFHMNLEQFFYATLIGLVFGYVYLRTGKLWICWLMHSLFNVFGGLIPALLLQYAGYDAILAAETSEQMLQAAAENPIGYAVIVLYSLLLLGIEITGVVFYFLYRKRLRFAETELTLPRDSEASAAFVNVGVILFVALCVALPILEAVAVRFA